MTDSPRYLIAKYVSDLQRMEPRNIGVIVCASGVASARFLGEKPGKPGQVDGRSVPSFVTSVAAYKQWVEFWRGELNGLPEPGKLRSRDWLEDLRHSSRGNFLLVEGGIVLDARELSNSQEMANELFSRLIEPNVPEEGRDPVLERVLDNAIRELRLRENQHFHLKYSVSCLVAPNVSERFEFSYAYANGTLKRLYQRVPLARRAASLRRVVHDSAWMFEKVVQQGIVSREHAIALVFAADERKNEPDVSRSLAVLGSVAHVANLADQTELLSAFMVE